MKKLLILAGVIALTTTTQVFAQDNAKPQGPCPLVQKEAPGPEFGCPAKMKKHHFDIQKFEQELKLTDAQKEQTKALREKQEAAVAPIKEQIKAKHQEMEAIFNERLTLKERQEKLAPIQKDLRALKAQIRDIRMQGKKDFEAILTKKQLKQLDKMKADAKKEFKAHRPKRCGDMHRRPPMPPAPQPVLEEDAE